MKRLFLVLMAELCSACPLSAAIITERNDVFSIFPESAVFRGTSAAPGIVSQWIPYGTYTGGSGGTEYLRVTSNLVGVVASVYDGYWERYNIGVNSSTNIRDYAYGELWTNDTRRVLDYINATRSPLVYGDWQGLRTNDYARECIEERLCPTSGLFAVAFGSRVLDALAVNVDPPIPTSWTAAIPFSAADADDWVSVWPTYNILTNDAHFLTSTNRTPWRNHVSSFLYLGNFAGQDYSAACDDLFDALDNKFVPVTMPEVLAYDTGLKYPNGSPTNDYWISWDVRLDGNIDQGWSYFGESLGYDGMQYYIDYWGDDDPYWNLRVIDEYGEVTGSPGYYLVDALEQGDRNFSSFDGNETRRIRLYDETDDFAHWRNMTRRLDWRRLGIICQLERQMETTYYPRGSDQLPLVAEYAEVGNTYTGSLSVAYTIAQAPDPDTGDWPVTWEGSLSDVNWQREGSSRDVTTNFQGMSFPVAAAGQPFLVAGIPNTSVTLGYFDIPCPDMKDLCANYFTTAPTEISDGNYFFSVYGTFSIGGTAATLNIEGGYIMDSDYEYHDEYHQDTFGYWSFESGSADFGLTLGESKSAHSTYTLSDALSARSNLVESITRNDIFFWNNGWIAERTLPTYEMMIAATNCADLVDVSFSEGWPVEMHWDDLAPSNGPQRVFRLSPEPTVAESRVALMNNRVAILLGLDREVKTRFASLAGQSVTSIASASANLTPSESAKLRAEIGAMHPPMHVTASTFQGDQEHYGYDDKMAYIVIDGHLDIASGVVEAATIDYVYDQEIVPIVNNAYRFGNWGLALGEAKAGMSATNCPPVRVDGHQSQMLKTLWRFKNLRDPNL